MRLLRRLFTSVEAQVDSIADRLENHDGIIAAAIRQANEQVARATVQLRRTQTEHQRLLKEQERLNTEAATWKQRALSCNAQDEQKALECLKRANSCMHLSQVTGTRATEMAELQKRVQTELARLKDRVRELQQRRTLLRTRQTTADAALTTAQLSDSSAVEGLDDVFDRWESKITTSELRSGLFCSGHGDYSGSTAEPLDNLEAEFSSAEELAALRAQLQELRTA